MSSDCEKVNISTELDQIDLINQQTAEHEK